MVQKSPRFSLGPTNTEKQRPPRKRKPDRFYGTSAWKRLRKQVIEDQPICAWPGCSEASKICDHVLRRAWGGSDERSNLQGLCVKHHGQKSWEETQPLARAHPKGMLPVLGPLVMVCGSPGSGKSSYAIELVGKDRVIDIDLIKAGLAGSDKYQAKKEFIGPALVLRNHALRELSKRAFTEPVALVIGAPTARERARWAAMLKPRVVVVMETPADEVIRRIHADPERQHCVDEHSGYVATWWRKYTKGRDELYVTPGNATEGIVKIAQTFYPPPPPPNEIEKSPVF